MLEKKEENKYRHYKGGIYYKLAKTIIVDDYREHNPRVKVIGEATFESTCEPMLILSKEHDEGTGTLSVCFRDRESDADTEFVEDVILYQAESNGKIWVRFTENFEEDVEPGVKRFTLIEE